MAALPQPDWRITAEEFAALQHDSLRMELVTGEILTLPPASLKHGATAQRLAIMVGGYVLECRLGTTYMATGFLLSRNPDTVRVPDLAFIATHRVKERQAPSFWGTIVPDFVIEVMAHDDRANEIDQKVQMWLGAGVRPVWAAWPQGRLIQVYEPPAPVQTLDEQATLTGGAVLPGFSTAVADIFG
jgi:Uma2 family endonuclease